MGSVLPDIRKVEHFVIPSLAGADICQEITAMSGVGFGSNWWTFGCRTDESSLIVGTVRLKEPKLKNLWRARVTVRVPLTPIGVAVSGASTILERVVDATTAR